VAGNHSKSRYRRQADTLRDVGRALNAVAVRQHRTWLTSAELNAAIDASPPTRRSYVREWTALGVLVNDGQGRYWIKAQSVCNDDLSGKSFSPETPANVGLTTPNGIRVGMFSTRTKSTHMARGASATRNPGGRGPETPAGGARTPPAYADGLDDDCSLLDEIAALPLPSAQPLPSSPHQLSNTRAREDEPEVVAAAISALRERLAAPIESPLVTDDDDDGPEPAAVSTRRSTTPLRTRGHLHVGHLEHLVPPAWRVVWRGAQKFAVTEHVVVEARETTLHMRRSGEIEQGAEAGYFVGTMKRLGAARRSRCT
jgi:hypothetical protein